MIKIRLLKEQINNTFFQNIKTIKSVNNRSHIPVLDCILNNEEPFENTILNSVQLKQLIGKGSYSAVFLDNDDHIVKIGEFREAFDDSQFYEQFKKNPTKHFVVYSFERIETYKNDELSYYGIPEKTEIFIAVTNKLIPFSIYYKMFDSEEAPYISGFDYVIGEILTVLERTYNEHRTQNLKEWILTIKEKGIDRQIYSNLKMILSKLPEDMINQLIQQYLITCFGIFRKGSYMPPDLFFRNLGVSVVSGLDHPRFFFFDR